MNRIQVNAKFANVSSSNLAEFKKVAAHALEIAKSEPGVLQYDWFFDDPTRCAWCERLTRTQKPCSHTSRPWAKRSPHSAGWAADVSSKCSAILCPPRRRHSPTSALHLPLTLSRQMTPIRLVVDGGGMARDLAEPAWKTDP
jgi:hypothetical protein